MVRIEKHDWFSDVFAQVISDCSLLRNPVKNFENLDTKEQDSLRQTEVFQNETIQVLGHYEEFSLIKKFDGTLGWVESIQFKINPQTKSMTPSFSVKKSDPLHFFKSWLGTPYVWGGLSKKGIDCSGFTQLYFFEVHHIILPKNSWDQRKLSPSKELKDIAQDDLVFCHRFDGKGTHHVVIYHDRKFWHSRRTGGVVCQSYEDFITQYDIEAIVSILKIK